jgi:poly-gamma-glutamate biosynthesis protein PgsC/CapC
MEALFAGIFVSLAISELTGFSPGGVVVAGYLALFVSQPAWLAGTLLLALLTFGAVRLIGSRTLLYGRREFAVYVLTGICFNQAASLLSSAAYMPWDVSILVIGYLIPGLIARDFARQGIINTCLAMGLAVTATRLVVLAGEGLLW